MSVINLIDCYFSESAGSFELLDSHCNSPKLEEQVLVITFGMPAAPHLIARSEDALKYGMTPNSLDIYEEDVAAESKHSFALDSSCHEDGEIVACPDVEMLKLTTQQKRQASLLQQTVAFDGLRNYFVACRRFPPKVPKFPSCNPSDWEQSLTKSKILVKLKLYDVMAVSVIKIDQLIIMAICLYHLGRNKLGLVRFWDVGKIRVGDP